jgi:protoheme IX farnesyltransferase
MSRGIEAPARPVVDDDNAVEPLTGASLVGSRVRDYALLLKPRVMSLVVFTGLVGLFLAPGTIDPVSGLIAINCIAIGAGASGSINMWYDRDIDRHMARTRNRPVPAGRVTPGAALWAGVFLSILSVATMAVVVNPPAAALLAVTIAFYVFVYTIWLKRRTPLNIVIGGAAGAIPPMIGWAAVTNGVDWGGVVLFAIIFLWTPPHFWALALFRLGDYERAGVPMLPVVSGLRETKKQIIIYSVLLVPVTLLPTAIGMSSAFYAVGAFVLGLLFLNHAGRVWRSESAREPRAMFLFSILYLFLLFVLLLADRVMLNLL